MYSLKDCVVFVSGKKKKRAGQKLGKHHERKITLCLRELEGEHPE